MPSRAAGRVFEKNTDFHVPFPGSTVVKNPPANAGDGKR